ncbi:MAG: hypothetical protein HY092_01055 [Candidatus Kerfeldbacteria bacterium]|nr:hypothetical protein [Candidatus Kerfeldbacteria bacterium]
MKPQGDLQLAIGYWLVSHKNQLRTWWAISLLAFIGLSLLWLVVFFTVFFGQQSRLDAQLFRSINRVADVHVPANLRPRPLQPTAAAMVQRDLHHLDLVATVTNPNQDWGARAFRYHFTVGGVSLPAQHTWVNQGSSRPVVQLNAVIDGGTAGTVSLVIDQINWARANAAALPEAIFSVDRPTLTPTSVSVGGQTISTLSVHANMTNRSVYNFYHVEIPVIAVSGTTVVAIDQVTIDRWATLTAKAVATTWPYPVAGASDVQIQPQVNRFDADNVYR